MLKKSYLKNLDKFDGQFVDHPDLNLFLFQTTFEKKIQIFDHLTINTFIFSKKGYLLNVKGIEDGEYVLDQYRYHNMNFSTFYH